MGFAGSSAGKESAYRGFPGGASGKEHSRQFRDIGDAGLIPGSGRSPGKGHGNPLQCSYLENSMDRGAWRATVHGVTELDVTEATWHTHSKIHRCPDTGILLVMMM